MPRLPARLLRDFTVGGPLNALLALLLGHAGGDLPKLLALLSVENSAKVRT